MRFTALCLAAMLTAHGAVAQQAEGNQVVVSAQGEDLTMRDLFAAYGLTWFMTTQVPTEAETQALVDAQIAEFKADPKAYRQGADLVTQMLLQAQGFSNPIEVGLYRMHVGNVLWSAVSQVEPADRGYLLNWIYEHNPVLAYDTENKMVFTALDGFSAVRYLMFLNGVVEPSEEQLATIGPMVQAFAENYVELPVETKRQVAVAGLLWQVVQAYWQQMTDEQKQQMLAGLQQQQAQPATEAVAIPETTAQNMTPETFRILQEINDMSHVTSMNIIENIGGTGNYWEIVDQPW